MRALPLLLLLAPLAAEAQGLADTHFARNFCWERAYDRDHLAQHPEQQVTWMSLGREPPGHPSAPGEYLVEVRVLHRAEGEEMESIAYCRPQEDRLECSQEGDFGNFRIEADGPDRVLVTPGDRGMGFEGDSGFYTLHADEGDDRSFLLRRCG